MIARCVRIGRHAYVFGLMGTALSVGAAGFAPDQLAVSAGQGEDVVVLDVGAVWAVPTTFDFLRVHNIGLRIAGDVSHWQGDDKGAPVTSLWDFGVTPLLRWSPPEGPWRNLFAEIGVGAHILSATEINYEKHFSTAFQFGERLAFGTTFGPAARYEVAAYVQHESNGKLKLPNDGLTQWGIMARLPLN